MSTQQRILNAAADLFFRSGYDGTSLSSIAKAVSISPPALYWHFNSKEDLFIATVESILEDFVSSVESAVAGNTPTERLREFSRAHVLWQLERRKEARAYAASLGFRELVASLPVENRQRIVMLQRAHVQTLRDILANGESSGEFVFDNLRVTAFAIITLCEYVFSWYNPDGELTTNDVAEQYSRLVIDMVTADVRRPEVADN